jgi:O-antigen/teichoic acid export membrane protein
MLNCWWLMRVMLLQFLFLAGTISACVLPLLLFIDPIAGDFGFVQHEPGVWAAVLAGFLALCALTYAVKSVLTRVQERLASNGPDAKSRLAAWQDFPPNVRSLFAQDDA